MWTYSYYLLIRNTTFELYFRYLARYLHNLISILKQQLKININTHISKKEIELERDWRLARVCTVRAAGRAGTWGSPLPEPGSPAVTGLTAPYTLYVHFSYQRHLLLLHIPDTLHPEATSTRAEGSFKYFVLRNKLYTHHTNLSV